MSHVEKIAGELASLKAGVEAAQGRAAAADQQAQEVALRAAGSGFAALAAGMVRVREAIGTIQGGLNGLAGATGEAMKLAAAVPGSGTPQETLAGLASVQNAVGGLHQAAVGVIDQIGHAQRLVATVLQGGQPGPMLSALDNIKQVVVLVVQRSAEARQAVEVATAEARQLGASVG
ncbi:DUF6244 family protein [Micromonospora sp. NPDC003197]